MRISKFKQEDVLVYGKTLYFLHAGCLTLIGSELHRIGIATEKAVVPTFILKIICKGRIHLLVFIRAGYNCVPLFIFSHEIVKSYINLVIKRGMYLNSRRHFPKPDCRFLPLDVRTRDIILAK